MQIFIYCKTTLHVSGVTAPIIRSIKICTRSLRYRSYCRQACVAGLSMKHSKLYVHSTATRACLQYDLYRRLWVQFLILLMMGAVTPETYRVVLQ